ncbi:MAG: TPM domain-containing protein [Burkholderiales bacterium]|nr:TPM domain-containing protein [Burkholderiales bacterium]
MRAFVAALAFCLAGAAAWAQSVLPVPPLGGRVVDQTATLTPPQAAALSNKLAAIETAKGAQVVILIVPTTAPEDIASFAQRVGEQWKVGRKEVGDGLIIVVAKNDRAVQIQVAKTLQGAVPDIAAGRIIQQQIVPAFRAGDYAGGLNSAVDRIGERIAAEGLPAPSPAQQGTARRDAPSGGFDLQSIGILLFIAVPIIGRILSGMLGRPLAALVSGAGVGGIAWLLGSSFLVAAGIGVVALFFVGAMGLGGSRGAGRSGGPIIWGGGGGFGGGGFGGGGSSGGFSSGGGGSFDGGGASGRW